MKSEQKQKAEALLSFGEISFQLVVTFHRMSRESEKEILDWKIYGLII